MSLYLGISKLQHKWIFAIIYISMSEPIVLLLLRVPVHLINVVTTVVGTMFYAPSYIMFLLIQVFNRIHVGTCLWQVGKGVAKRLSNDLATEVHIVDIFLHVVPRTIRLSHLLGSEALERE